MKVQIWSDVMCPFCYIGKRRFEEALSVFPFKNDIEVEWKSFQLNPSLKTNPDVNIDQYLADAKGWTLEYAQQLNKQVTEMAAQVGLTYNFENSVVANSFNAHRYTHLAKQYNLGEAAEEQLFKAYFTDGKNIDDIETLTDLGIEIGLDVAELKESLNNPEAFANEVHRDISEAETLGVRGVPFFVMNNRYAISGAQATEVFSNTLISAYSEWQQQFDNLKIIEGPSCDADGNC